MEKFLIIVLIILTILMLLAFLILMYYFVSAIVMEVRDDLKERKFRREINKLHDNFWSKK